jgi:hypothetical protein
MGNPDTLAQSYGYQKIDDMPQIQINVSVEQPIIPEDNDIQSQLLSEVFKQLQNKTSQAFSALDHENDRDNLQSTPIKLVHPVCWEFTHQEKTKQFIMKCYFDTQINADKWEVLFSKLSHKFIVKITFETVIQYQVIVS